MTERFNNRCSSVLRIILERRFEKCVFTSACKSILESAFWKSVLKVFGKYIKNIWTERFTKQCKSILKRVMKKHFKRPVEESVWKCVFQKERVSKSGLKSIDKAYLKRFKNVLKAFENTRVKMRFKKAFQEAC